MNKISVTILVLFITGVLHGKEFRIITPYIGTINNKLEVSDIDQKLDDSACMEGIYLQRIDPERYQWNVFLYYSNDINYSSILGNHFIFDYYLGKTRNGYYALGFGFEWLKIDTKTSSLDGISDFSMLNNVYAPYIRAGKYFNFQLSNHPCTLFLWGGFESDILRGDLNFRIPSYSPFMPEILVKEEINEHYEYSLAGIMLQATLHHFLQIKLKYHAKISTDDQNIYHVASSMVNLYLNRHLGLSYRFKYMEGVIGDNVYHLLGLAFIH